MSCKRLSICYAAPGQALSTAAGPTRNVLNLAGALSQWADVTVAFRSLQEPIGSDKYRVIAIEPPGGNCATHTDDDATRGVNPFVHSSYLRVLWSFSRQWASSYDLVLEKGWRFSGFLLAAFRSHGVPGVLIENDVRHWSEPLRSLRTVLKYILHRMAQVSAGFYSRRVPVIIAETEELKTLLAKERRISPSRVEVVGLGVDHSLFHPLDQRVTRELLGINPAATVLLYVGGMDKYHDLGPVIDALSRVRPPSALECHVVGDGEHRVHYEEKARHAQVPVRWHGQVSHRRVPQYIAAADICLAPYKAAAFHSGQVPFSTLKIPEYMACGRPAISVPSGHIQRLIEDQVSGFLFPNEVSSWVSFLETLPSRQRLKEMGQAAAGAVQHLSWERTARRYLEVCQRLVTQN